MTATTVLLLIGALIGLLVMVNAIEQYKQKVAHERHQLLLKLAAIINENDELLINSVQLPMTVGLQKIITRRSIAVIEQVLSMVPDSHSMPNRLREANEHLNQLNQTKGGPSPLVVPNNDGHNAAMIKTIKKLRYVLSKQQAKGSITKREFATEDLVLSHNLIRIFVEYKMIQGAQAITDDKLGSARQFYDKALKTLREQSVDKDYTLAKEREIIEQMEKITQLLHSKENPVSEKLIEVGDDSDLELVFSDTKKKWDME